LRKPLTAEDAEERGGAQRKSRKGFFVVLRGSLWPSVSSVVNALPFC
jgi:hypothetical protein